MSRGNNTGRNVTGRTACSVVVAAAITFGTTVGSYRLKKTAQLRYWQKALSDYSLQLENENFAAVKAVQDSLLED